MAARTRFLQMNRVVAICARAALALGLLLGFGAASAQSCGHAGGSEARSLQRLLVQPRAGLSNAELDRLLAPYGGRRTEVIRQINVHVIELPPEADAAAVAEALGRDPRIQFAEVDRAVRPQRGPALSK